MKKKMMLGMAALALLAVVALSAVSTYAYPNALAASSGDRDRDRLQIRLQTQDRDCEIAGNGTMAQNGDQICAENGAMCDGDQYRLTQQSRLCLSQAEQAENALQARNQIMARIGSCGP